MGGGTAIFIKDKYKFTQINLRNQSNLKNIETSILKLNLKNNKKLYIISAYATNVSMKGFVKDLSLIFHELQLDNLNNYYIRGGHLNHTIMKKFFLNLNLFLNLIKLRKCQI